MNKINFENLPSTNTPLSAENLNLLQDNVENAIPVLDSTISTTSTNGIENQAITNYVDEKALDIYSTDETRIGIWTTGKPLYRKVYKADNISNSYSLTPPPNVNIYTKLRVMQLDGDGAFVPDYYFDSTDYLRIFKNNNGIQIRTSKKSNTFTHWIIVEYTKTTD